MSKQPLPDEDRPLIILSTNSIAGVYKNLVMKIFLLRCDEWKLLSGLSRCKQLFGKFINRNCNERVEYSAVRKHSIALKTFCARHFSLLHKGFECGAILVMQLHEH